MKNLLRHIGTIATIATVLGTSPIAAMAAVDTAPGHNKIQCFDGSESGYNGECTITSKGAKGSATLDNNDGDSDPYNNYSGVYTATSNMYGKTLDNVRKLSFSYSGDEATAGAPRFSVPLSTDGNASTDLWAYISAFHCNDGDGFVDAINDSSCTIHLSDGTFYANWDALVTAHPTWTVATDNYVFLIADEPGMWNVTGVTFGKPGQQK